MARMGVGLEGRGGIAEGGGGAGELGADAGGGDKGGGGGAPAGEVRPNALRAACSARDGV
jgi:hypothetical protein